MEMASGREFTTILISESGTRVELTDMACILGQTEIGTRENGTCVSNKETELILLLAEIHILESTRMANLMARANTLGHPVPFT